MNFKNLDELFNAWKKAHSDEPESSCAKTFPKNEEGISPDINKFKGSFCKDGYLTDKEHFNGVLFILKESNTAGRAEVNNTFWFRDCEGAKRWNLYRNSMVAYLKNYIGEDIDYRECAYMSFNKRGGYGSCNDKQLTGYVEKYHSFIKNQIEIIKPRYIICCGAGIVFDLVLPIVEGALPNVTIYDCYHLCCTKRICKRTNKI